MQRTSLPSAVLTTLVLVATPALATTSAAQLAPGSTLVFTGSANASDLGSPGVLLDFAKLVRADPSATTGPFTSLNDQPHGAIGSIEAFTVGNGPQQVRKVLQFGPYKFDLAYLPSGAYGQDDCYVMPVAGQRCTPYQFPSYELSPFYLENVASDGSGDLFTALVSFDVFGTVKGRGQTSAFFGTITATFAGVSYQEALYGLEQQGLTNVPFTGTFVVNDGTRPISAGAWSAMRVSMAPEPSTVGLVAAGMLGVAGIARRRRSRNG